MPLLFEDDRKKNTYNFRIHLRFSDVIVLNKLIRKSKQWAESNTLMLPEFDEEEIKLMEDICQGTEIIIKAGK